MPKNSYITVTDQFCGAGGSSQGARAAGIEVKLAMNHWSRAIETHQANFPNTAHECTDISACDPRRYHSTHILITSPECTNHSLAKGKKAVTAQMDLYASGIIDAAAERSRATMWDVCRFAEYHKYEIIIVENVVDARKWVMWEPWLMAMQALGYMHKCVYLNSMHCHPTPQSRDRMYVVFWKKGNKAPDLDYRPKGYCQKCEKETETIQVWKNKAKQYGKYKQQYLYRCPSCSSVVEPYYYAAFNCIDWSDRGKRIGDRKKPLSPNTMRRIEHGLKKYGSTPSIVLNYTPGYNKSIFEATGTFTANDHHAIVTPYIVNDQQSTGVGFRVKSSVEHLPTIPTEPHLKLIVPPPIILQAEHTKQLNVRGAHESMQTQTTRQSMGLVVPPAFMVENKKTSNSRPISETAACMTTVPYHGVVTTEAFNAFIHYNYGKDTLSHISDPLGAATTKDRHALVSYETPKADDCYYRMLKPNEVKLAMAFDKDYIITGSGKDQVKQLGNAVTPPAMEWLVNQCAKTL